MHQPHDAAPPSAAERARDGDDVRDHIGEQAGQQAGEHIDEQTGEQTGQQAGDHDGPRPLGVAVRLTGNAEVDARLARLTDADGLGVGGHVEVYEDVHRGLRETLAALDRPSVIPRS